MKILNEMSCWRWDWEAFGAISTASAALIALWIWWHARYVSSLHLRKRVRVHQQLMIEELSRVSTSAVFLFDNLNDLRVHLLRDETTRQISENLQASFSNELLKMTDGLPEDLAVSVAKLISLVIILRNSVILINKQLNRKIAEGLPQELDALSRDAIARYAPQLVGQALIVARALESSGDAPAGSIEKAVKLPATPVVV